MTTEHVCGLSETEVPMGELNETVRDVVGWLKKWSFEIAVMLSILHIGLACIHARDSGGTNLTLASS